MDADEAVFLGILIAWLIVAVLLLAYCRVFRRASLANAPARQSWLSLPVVGAIILAYFAVQTAVLLGAMGVGLISLEGLAPAGTMPSTSQATSTAGQTPESAPVSWHAEARRQTDSAARIVTINAIGVITYGILIVPVLILVPLSFKDGFRGWGLHIAQLPKGVLLGLLGFIIVYPLVTWCEIELGVLYEYLQHTVQEHTTFQALKQDPPWWQQVLLYAVAVFVAPVAEEIFFRGILQTALVQYGWGFLIPQIIRPGLTPRTYQPSVSQRWGAIVIASAAFALVHEIDAAPIIFVLALGLGYVYERTGNLWAPIVLHIGFNSAQLVMHGL